ncbi:MAG: amidohydrolase family protein [Planctomycetales bacterium]|nr:amidohydrolase family protein [Planctomycetales bacterium]
MAGGGLFRATGCLAALLAASPARSQAPPAAAKVLAIRDATVIPVSGPILPRATVLVRGGKIAEVGPNVAVPPGAEVHDGRGKFLTPGVIDPHSHMGVYPWPGTPATSDGNEASAPVTAEVRAADSIHVEDPAFARARAGGVTTVQILPGSANLIGGEAAIVKLRPVPSLAGMRFEGAPRGLKMAVGENPKRVYGGRGKTPSTRMGNAAVMRQAFIKAREYLTKWDRYRAKLEEHRRKLAAGEEKAEKEPEKPETDLQLETLAAVLRGEVRVHIHCYQTHDIEFLFRLSDEFGFKIACFHHGLEAYKVADEIARREIGVTTWTDWWGFKIEAFDGIPYAFPILLRKGVLASLHSDSSSGVQRLYHEAAKAVRYGVSEEDAFKLFTLNPAKQLGIEARVGTIEPGKDADLALFDRHPFDMYARVEKTFIDGVLVYERGK